MLIVNSSWSSPDPCRFTCKGNDIIMSSIYNSSSCSQDEVTSSHNYTLRLNCSGDSIMCNYSNPVSWNTDTKKVNELCTVNQGTSSLRQGTENVWHWTRLPVGLNFSMKTDDFLMFFFHVQKDN